MHTTTCETTASRELPDATGRWAQGSVKIRRGGEVRVGGRCKTGDNVNT